MFTMIGLPIALLFFQKFCKIFASNLAIDFGFQGPCSASNFAIGKTIKLASRPFGPSALVDPGIFCSVWTRVATSGIYPECPIFDGLRASHKSLCNREQASSLLLRGWQIAAKSHNSQEEAAATAWTYEKAKGSPMHFRARGIVRPTTRAFFLLRRSAVLSGDR